MKKSFTLISVTTFYGGGEEYIIRLVSCLQDDFDINVICCSNLLREKLQKSKANIEMINEKGILRYIKVFMKILKLPNKEKEVLVLNGQGAAFLAPIIPVFFKKKLLIQHTSIEYYNSKIKIIAIKSCYQKLDAIICVSEFLKNEIEKYVKNVPLKVIYNWLPIEAVKPVDYNPFEKTLKLIFIGRLVEVKGILPLINLVTSLKDTELYVLGDGPLYNYIKSNFSHLGFIHLLGWQNNKLPIMGKVHLNVVNSFSEGYSYTPVETGVCGIPSLISDLKVHKELSENGKYSFIFKTGSAEDLKSKLNYLKENRAELNKMSQLCKKHFVTKFVFSNYKERYVEEFN